MAGPQFFKGDSQELKFYGAGNPILQNLEVGKDEFFDGAYSCFKLGETLYDSGRSPLANAIPRDIFREAFSTIFNSFLEAGSFESYLTVFRNIFGDDVEVTFTVPAPGKLEISITSTNLVTSVFLAKQVVGDSFIFDEITDHDGDSILFQTIKGLETEYELKKMLFEMVPNGIYTVITLSVGV